jgi:hypothetical protein
MNISQENPQILVASGGHGGQTAATATVPDGSNLVIENLNEFAAAGVVSYCGSSIADFIIREPRPLAAA